MERFKLRDFIVIEFVVLFLCAIEFLSKFYSIVFLLFLVLLIKRKIQLSALKNRNFICILFFCLFYFLFAYEGTPLIIIPVWLLSYVIGFSIADNSRRFTTAWFIIASGVAIHGFLLCYYNINTYGQDAMGNRIMYDIWGNDLMRGATSLACSFLLGSSFIVPIFSSQRRWLAILYSVFIVFCVFFNSILTASRSALIYPTIILLATLYPVLRERNNGSSILFAFSAVGLLLIAYWGDVFGFRSFFEGQFLFERFVEKDGGGVIENQRLDLWANLFNHFGDYFWTGGATVDNDARQYVHNIVLDTFAVGGIFPSLLLTLLIVWFIKTIVTLYKQSSSLFFRSLYMGLCFGFVLIFMTEPIIQAANWFFSYFLMLVGGLDRVKSLRKQNKWL